MNNQEKIERIVEDTGVTYEEAKRALESCDYDMLDAILYLETLGRIKNPGVASYTTSSTQKNTSDDFKRAEANYDGRVFKKHEGNFWDGFNDFINACLDTSLFIIRNNREILRVPIIVVIIIAFSLFYIVVPLLVIGILCDCRFHVGRTWNPDDHNNSNYGDYGGNSYGDRGSGNFNEKKEGPFRTNGDSAQHVYGDGKK